MEELKPILIKPIVKKYYDKLKTNEQRLEFLENLVFRGMDGQEPQIEDEMVELALMPCLDSIRECRENYNRRQAKNAEYGIQGKEHGIEGKDYGIQGKEHGIEGKEYGIQGKEFGKLGGRPRKGESPEEYVIRKKGDCEWTQAFKKIKQDQELIEKIKTNSVSTETIEELSKKYSKDTVIDVMRWIKEKN